jgi:dipeptidyl aminopeptidase/acylaminoacyl peptidase
MARPGYEADHPRILVRTRAGGREVEFAQAYDGRPLGLLFRPPGTTLLFTAADRGYQNIFEASESRVVPLIERTYAEELSISRDGRRLVFAREGADQPPEVAGLEMDRRAVRPLTALNAWLPPKLGFQRAEHVWFDGAAGAKIHGVLVRPPRFQRGKRYPAVVIVHGGPQGMEGDEFHPRWNLQMFAAEGYVVFGINFHGSTGFGQRFTDAITGDWGGKPYEDVMRGTEWLARQPFVIPDKICAAGASYGGYLVNWIATHTTRFSCLISHAGLYNIESKYGSTDELWFPEWEFKGTPWTNRALYRKWSPHSYAEKIRTPTLVIHGQRDFRVPVEQALQMFTALQRQGVPSRLLYFPDEDHFVQKPRNVELWWKTMREWLARHLR